jgi:phosphate:Na+ symporter
VTAKQVWEIACLVIGGLGLFLFGMREMSDALRRVAGDRMRHILRVLTSRVPLAVLAGTGITCIIQSSSATTVMVVGFVNAGLMSLQQAVGVIMGANIGTTITGWLVSFVAVMKVLKITSYALPAIGIGLGLQMFGKRKWKNYGTLIFGFGLLFFGLDLLKEAFDPLSKSPEVSALMARWAGNPITGVLIGALMTCVIQSSSATIAIAQMLALSNVVTLPQALPLVIGDNIGTTITANLASIGTNVNARRAARAHFLFNFLGCLVMLPLLFGGRYAGFISRLLPTDNVAAQIALSHTIFNVASTLVFMPLAGLLAVAARALVPGKADVVEVEPKYLEEHLLENPPIALEQARREVVRMIELAASAVRDASSAFFGKSETDLRLVAQKEEAVDNLQDKITQYLISISRYDLEPASAKELPVLLHSVNDIERIGDHALNLAEAAQRRIDQRLEFTPPALEELDKMRGEVDVMFDNVIRALQDSDPDAARIACDSETRLNAMEREFRESHLNRLQNGDCNFYSGLTFVDCVYNYEKIGDHLTNAAQAVLGDFQWGEPEGGPEPNPQAQATDPQAETDS